MVCCFLAAFLHLLWKLLERIWPEDDIELAPDFPSAVLTQMEASVVVFGQGMRSRPPVSRSP